MKSRSITHCLVPVFAAGLMMTPAKAATNVWSGGNTNVTFNWSSGGNWAGGVPPGGSDNVKFLDPGAAGAVSNVNNIVDGSFSGPISSLHYGNTNGFHATFIAPGVSLGIAGGLAVGAVANAGLYVGTGVDGGNTHQVSTTITGPAASLAINNPAGNFAVGQTTTAANNVQRATLDMTDLATFTANVSNFWVAVQPSGAANAFSRATATLNLARTNIITVAASGLTTGFVVGENNGTGNGGANLLYLGQTNAIFADTVAVGASKTQSNLFSFNPAYVGNNPAVYLRGRNAPRIARLSIGDHGLQANSSNQANGGAVDFSTGTVDAMVDIMYVGRTRSAASGTPLNIGIFAFSAGTVDINSLYVGYHSGGAAGNGSGSFNLIGSGALVVNSTLELAHFISGTGTATGTLSVNGGAVTVKGGLVSGGGTSAVYLTNATLNLTNFGAFGGSPAAPLGTLYLSNSTVRLAVNSAITNLTASALTTEGVNPIVVSSVFGFSSYPSQVPLIKYSSISGVGFSAFTLTLPGGVTGSLVDNTANSSVDLLLTSGPTGGGPLTWNGFANGSNNGNWDIGLTVNWLATNAVPSAYQDASAVSFDDTATGTTTVNLTTTVIPTSVTVSNNTKTYAFNGAGRITGPANLTKNGGGTLILNEAGVNNYSGSTTISSGTVQVGTNGIGGNLGAGAIENNGTLIFMRTNSLTIPGIISGAGSITQNGSGILTFSGANTFSSQLTVTRGTLRVDNNAALGDATGTTVVNNGTTLDLGGASLAQNGLNIPDETIVVAGAGVDGSGVIVNSSAFSQINALRHVVLAGHTTFGGPGNAGTAGGNTPGRWDIRGTGASLSTDGQAYNITKVGLNQVNIVGATVDASLANVEVQAGLFGLQGLSSFGNPASTITVFTNAILRLTDLGASVVLVKVVVLKAGATLHNTSGDNSFGGTIELQGNTTFNVAGTQLTLTNSLHGAGSLYKVGTAPLLLTGNSIYAGLTVVSNGTLFVNGSKANGTSLAVYANATLGGVGAVGDPVTIAAGGTLSPGDAATTVSALVISNSLSLAGTNVMDVNKSGSNFDFSDLITNVTTLSFGGTLQLNLTGDPLALGDAIKLYSFTSANGAFAQIIPTTPGANLSWDTSTLTTDGRLRVGKGRPSIGSVAISGGNLIIEGTGGEPLATFYVLASANVATPLTNWLRILTNTFDGSGNFSLSAPLDPAFPTRFFVLQLP